MLTAASSRAPSPTSSSTMRRQGPVGFSGAYLGCFSAWEAAGASSSPSLAQHPDCEFSTQVSYLEVYNENGYDLLDPRNDIRQMEDLPKVLLPQTPFRRSQTYNGSFCRWWTRWHCSRTAPATCI